MAWRGVACAVGALVVALTLNGADAASSAQQQNAPRASGYGQVFLMRGFLGRALTSGLDELGAKLERRGVQVSVDGFGSADTLADEAIAKYRAGNHGPIVIIGHSLGAVAAMEMARKLRQKRVPVGLIVTFGPTGDLHAPANVTSVVNYYQSKSVSSGRVLRGPGFHGSIANIDLEKSVGMDHLSMTRDAALHAWTISRVLALVGARPAPTAASSAATSAASSSTTVATSRASTAPEPTQGLASSKE